MPHGTFSEGGPRANGPWRRGTASFWLRSPPPGSGDGDGAWEVDELWAALARLPPGQRRVLTRIHLDEASPAEVAREEGICVHSVNQRVWRARRALKALLEVGEGLKGGKA